MFVQTIPSFRTPPGYSTWLFPRVFAARGLLVRWCWQLNPGRVERKNHRAMLEMPSKNNPAMRLAQKLGYEFCGYNDQYYETQDIALFFGRSIR